MAHHCIRHDVLRTENTIDAPNAITPMVTEHVVDASGEIHLRLAGWSWNLVRIGLVG